MQVNKKFQEKATHSQNKKLYQMIKSNSWNKKIEVIKFNFKWKLCDKYNKIWKQYKMKLKWNNKKNQKLIIE
jgi:hypothetical protein